MSTQLRPYQEAIVAKAWKHIQACHTTLVYAPTGAGKTEIALHLALKQGGALFITPNIAICEQTQKRFEKYGVACGIIQGGKKRTEGAYQVATYQTLARRKNFPETKLIILDEAHHTESDSYQKIVDYYKEQGVPVVGLSATPYLLSHRKHLSHTFNAVVAEVGVQELIDMGYLSKFKYFAVTPKNLASAIAKLPVNSTGDYTQGSMDRLLNQSGLIHAIIGQYEEKAKGLPCLIFCVSVAHADAVALAFAEAGYASASLTGNTPEDLRAIILDRFKSGQLQVLCSVNCLAEGFDAPNAAAAILARPTQSKSLYIQQVGRLLRTFPGKEFALLIDLVGNWERHGLPNARFNPDSILNKEIEEKRDFKIKYKVCKSCHQLAEQGDTICPHCGAEFPRPEVKETKKTPEFDLSVKEKVETKQVNLEVVAEIDRLVDLAKLRGYKPRWAFYRLVDSKLARFVGPLEIQALTRKLGYKRGASKFLWEEWNEKYRERLAREHEAMDAVSFLQ